MSSAIQVIHERGTSLVQALCTSGRIAEALAKVLTDQVDIHTGNQDALNAYRTEKTSAIELLQDQRAAAAAKSDPSLAEFIAQCDEDIRDLRTEIAIAERRSARPVINVRAKAGVVTVTPAAGA